MELPGVIPPENPVELPGVAPPENEVYSNGVPLLLPTEYDRNIDSDDNDEDTDTYTKQHRRVIHPEAMSKTVRNAYNLRLWKQTDYVKENIIRLMSFAQVENDLKNDSFSLLKHKGMEHSEDTIDYETVIEYTFTKYSLK